MDAYAVRKMFQGTILPGIFSYFQHIIRREEAEEVVILKGGRGSASPSS